MAKKNQHIEQQLAAAIEKGDYKVIVAAGEPVWNHVNDFDIIRVSPTPTSSYSFPNTPDTLKMIERRRKSLERKMANRTNYGDERGRSAVFSDNETTKQLALLSGRPDYLRVAYRAWCLSQQAPKEIQKYVYHNLIVRANRYHSDSERFYLRSIDAYTFQVLPPAWRKCIKDPCPELEGVSLAEATETLTPAFRVGQTIARKLHGKFVKCVVVGYEYNHRCARGVEEWSNPIDLEYRIRYAEEPAGPHAHIYTLSRSAAYPAFHAE